MFDKQSIFLDCNNTDCISIEHIVNDQSQYTCVFGVYDTEIGKIIKKDMLKWLEPEYDIYIVTQKENSGLYEYPALRFMQYLIETLDKPILYIHTKGAAHNEIVQDFVRQFWKRQLTGKNKLKYFEGFDDDIPVVNTMLTGKEKITWFNSFVANKKALEEIGIIKPNPDRYIFEKLFCNTNVIVNGLISNLCNDNYQYLIYTFTLSELNH